MADVDCFYIFGACHLSMFMATNPEGLIPVTRSFPLSPIHPPRLYLNVCACVCVCVCVCVCACLLLLLMYSPYTAIPHSLVHYVMQYMMRIVSCTNNARWHALQQSHCHAMMSCHTVFHTIYSSLVNCSMHTTQYTSCILSCTSHHPCILSCTR